jgi:predicted small lipoprotein YifL
VSSRSRRGLAAPAVLIGALAVIGGCGQKGALTLPESARPIKRIETPNASGQPAAPAPSPSGQPASSAPGASEQPASPAPAASGQEQDSANKDDANGR